jgi:flagellar basal-body rod protein FlgB
MLDSIALFNGMNEKMGYLQTRQRVLSQNITNSDSPGYQAMDIKAPSFKDTMGRYINPTQLNNGAKLSLTTTAPGQVAHLQMLNRADSGSKVDQTYEVTPIKNSVNIEEQMMQSSGNAVDYQLVTNLYSKNLNLLRTVIK